MLQTCVSEHSTNTATFCAEHTNTNCEVCKTTETSQFPDTSRRAENSVSDAASCLQQQQQASWNAIHAALGLPHHESPSCPSAALLDPPTPPRTQVNSVQPAEQAVQIF